MSTIGRWSLDRLVCVAQSKELLASDMSREIVQLAVGMGLSSLSMPKLDCCITSANANTGVEFHRLW